MTYVYKNVYEENNSKKHDLRILAPFHFTDLYKITKNISFI